MSAQGVADKVASVPLSPASAQPDFVMYNFAPPDMVGHMGVYEAAVEAVTATDKAVGTVYEAAEKAGYILLITADHGNAEQMINPEMGTPFTVHMTNPVPFIMTGDPKVLSFKKEAVKAEGGGKVKTEELDPPALCDVGPTILAVMGLDIPEEMTGRSLSA